MRLTKTAELRQATQDIVCDTVYDLLDRSVDTGMQATKIGYHRSRSHATKETIAL